MEIKEDIVIVGGGIAGLTTALGLHRLGLRSLVLESSDALRITGFALTLWTNAWRALDAVGIGNSLRQHNLRLDRIEFASSASINPTSEQSSNPIKGKYDRELEVHCVRRKELLETLERELPHGTIRYSSRVVSIEDSGYYKLLHLADGTIVKTKVLIGCDGINSAVAKWLGLETPVNTGRSSIRGLVEYPEGHGFQPKFHLFFVGGGRYGFAPITDKFLYWFCTFNSSAQNDEELERNPFRMKEFILSRIGNIPQQAVAVVERTELDRITSSPLKLRLPWNLLIANISKGNVCVAGDALHPMTPDIGQGGCSALEDGVVLARCLGEALLKKSKQEGGDDEEYERIKKSLERFAKERRWRSFSLISTAYVVGFLQESGGKVMTFLMEKFLSGFTVAAMCKMADFHVGNLVDS